MLLFTWWYDGSINRRKHWQSVGESDIFADRFNHNRLHLTFYIVSQISLLSHLIPVHSLERKVINWKRSSEYQNRRRNETNMRFMCISATHVSSHGYEYDQLVFYARRQRKRANQSVVPSDLNADWGISLLSKTKIRCQLRHTHYSVIADLVWPLFCIYVFIFGPFYMQKWLSDLKFKQMTNQISEIIKQFWDWIKANFWLTVECVEKPWIGRRNSINQYRKRCWKWVLNQFELRRAERSGFHVLQAENERANAQSCSTRRMEYGGLVCVYRWNESK